MGARRSFYLDHAHDRCEGTCNLCLDGNAFTEPAAKTSDAIVAFDMRSGKILWSYQGVETMLRRRDVMAG